MKTFLHIKSFKFPILEGEKEELVNEGMYGKALSIYLQEKLKLIGYDVPFFCCEDWGWWVEIKSKPISFGICIYSLPNDSNPEHYVCCPSINGEKKWNWKKFGYIDTKSITEKIVNDLKEIFESDSDIDLIEITEDMPF